jgi:hypothetical protein
MNRTLSTCLMLASATLVAACGGGSSSTPPAAVTAPVAPFTKLADIAVPNVNSTTAYSFDIGTISGTKYYVTDRNNAGIDVVDIPTKTLTTVIQGTGALAFTGVMASNANSGPNGVYVVGNLLYAGDVNSVKIVDPVAHTVLKSVIVGTAGVRADEGCLDSVHNIFMISSPEAVPPFSAFINTTTQQVVAKVTFTDAAGNPGAGLEECEYDANTDTFYVNNDGTTANPHGELDKLPGASIRAIAAGGSANYTTLAGVGMFSEGNCDPTGLALGPNSDIAVGCREATTGAPLLFEIFNRSTGALVTALNAGGGDELAYDATTNRYYDAASRWTASGNASAGGACTTASPCTPVLTVIDAAARTILAQIPTGNNAHSVAVDPATGLIFMPYSEPASPVGCANCTANGFINGGILAFSNKP